MYIFGRITAAAECTDADRQTGSQSDGRTGKNRSLIGLGVHKQVSIRSSMQNPLFGSLSALQPRRLKVHWPAACLYGTIRSERRASFYESARCLDRLLFWDIVEKQPHAFLSSFSISASAIRTLLLFLLLLLQERGAAAAEAGAILRATWGSLIVLFSQIHPGQRTRKFPSFIIKYLPLLFPICRPVLPAAAGAGRAAGRGGNRRRLAPQGSELQCNFASNH